MSRRVSRDDAKVTGDAPAYMNLEIYVPDINGLVYERGTVGHATDHVFETDDIEDVIRELHSDDHIHKVAPMRIKGKRHPVIACPVCLVDIDGRSWK